mmetsp:Transcript_16926/g.36620  ORF Transcript_16926/g.36620 Transcript_16926/m.36620 type:complete len:442 (+) Transcript_16926:98-1423(+)
MESYHSVVVVGAGPSGLYAAYLLKKQFPDVLVVEAQDRIGGRIKQVHGLAPWPIEAGPEFVHGSNSILVELLKEAGYNFTEKGWPDYWYFGKEKELVHDTQVDDEISKVHELFAECGDLTHPPPGQDVSALDWLKSQGATDRMLAVAESCYANDFCCSLSQLGLREMIEESRRWEDGDTYLQNDRSMGKLVEYLVKELTVRTSCPVERVQYGQEGVVLHCSEGRTVRCRRAILTVPLRLMQDAVITFSPPLPPAKQDAIRRIKMGNVVKIILTFKEAFWPPEMYDVVCTDAFVPEFWMLKYPATNPGQGHPHCIVGFLSGTYADAASAMPPRGAVDAFLNQLNEIYGKPGNPKPATDALAQYQVVDWSKERWVRGAYTYPTLGAELGDREALAAPLAGTLFFAGEATSISINPCIQGAMETAQRAVQQVLAMETAPQHSRL